MPKPPLKAKLATVDELFFTTQEERDDMQREKVIDIPLGEIDSFPDHPFQVRVDDEMRELAENIREHGVLTPAIARQKKDGRYELVSGHRRKTASELAGEETLPMIVREMDDDTAQIYMVDSNSQRERILPSEKARAFRMKYEALKRQGKRTDLTSAPLGTKLRSDEVIAREAGESRNQIQRYIRLTELIPELLQMVDDNKLAFRPAVELSYLTEEQQRDLLDKMGKERVRPSLTQAAKLKQLSQDGKLNSRAMLSVLRERKASQVEMFIIPRDRIAQFFDAGATPAEIEKTILEALEFLHRKRERSRDRER